VQRAELRYAMMVTAASAFAMSAGALRHEWWRDEANTWLVARASRTIGQMLSGIGYNGHPKAYYVMAWLLSRISGSTTPLAISNLGFAVGAVFLFSSATIFSRLHRALFAFGFFPIWQYGVVVRSYAAFIFFLFAYAALRTARPERIGLRMGALVLMAQVHAMAAMAAAVLLVFDLVSVQERPLSRTTKAWTFAVGASIGLAAWQVIPPDEGFRAMRVGPPLHQAIANGFLPNFIAVASWRWQLDVGLGLAVLAVVAVASSPRALAVWAALASTLAATHLFAYPGHRWHHGLWFVYLVLAVWLAGGLRQPSISSGIVTTLLLVQAAVGIYALGADVFRPYSDGRAVADEIRRHGMERLPLVGVRLDNPASFRFDVDRVQPVLLGLPEGRAYDPVAGRLEPFWRHYDRPLYFVERDRSQLTSCLAAIAARLRSDVLVVTESPGPDRRFPVPPELSTLVVPPAAMDYGEQLALYLYRRR
jgi:hypothetical protein